MIADSVCQKLTATKHTYSLINGNINTEGAGEFYTTESAGIVYLWNGSVFDTLVPYSAVPGDQWEIPLSFGIMIHVTDTGHMTIDGQWLRYLAVQVVTDWAFVPPDTIYERIGPLNMYLSLLPSFFIDYAYGNLRCYSDNEMSYSRVDWPCVIPLGISHTANDPLWEVYPNPAATEICLRVGRSKPYSAELHDVYGRVVKQWTLKDLLPTPCLPLQEVAPGRYSLRLLFPDGWQQRPVIVAR